MATCPSGISAARPTLSDTLLVTPSAADSACWEDVTSPCQEKHILKWQSYGQRIRICWLDRARLVTAVGQTGLRI